MSGGDHTTPIPGLRGPRIPILSGRGIAYFALRSGWRYFVTGREIIGRGDNATFLHAATKDYRDKPYEKLTGPRWQRVLRRNLLVGIPGSLLTAEGVARVVAAPFGWVGETPPGWTEVPWVELLQGYAVGGPLAAGVIVAPRARTWYAERETRKNVIYPATRVACSILGQRWDRRTAVAMLQLPAGFGEPSEDDVQPSVRLYLPPVPLDKRTKDRITSNVGARLGLPDATGEWQEFGGKAWVQLSGADIPPKRLELSMTVRLEDESAAPLREAILSADLNHPVIGVASGGRAVRLDYADDSPNVAASGGTGTGKSTLLRLLAVQRLRAGAGRIILDLKGISHPYAHRLPRTRVLYFHEIEEIHDACVAIGEELFRRKSEAVAAVKAGQPVPEFRPVDVDVEEANSLMVDLQTYWTNRRAEIKRENRAALELDPDADVTEPPVRSPAVDALGFLIQMGREFCMFPHYAGQRLSVAAFGGAGGDRRESFQQRLLAKWTRATWRMLCPDVPYRVCPSGPRGIWGVVRGERVDMVRVPFVSVDEAVRMVLDSPDPGTPILPLMSGHVRTIEGEAVRPDRLADVRGQRVSLSTAAGRLGLTVNALQVASKRREDFPEPLEIGGPGKPNLYDLAALIEWRERRDGLGLQVGPGPSR